MTPLVATPDGTGTIGYRLMMRRLPLIARVLAFLLVVAAAVLGPPAMGVQIDVNTLQPLENGWSWEWVTAYFVFWIVGNSILWPTLAGGILFGFPGGLFMGIIGAVLGAVTQFLTVRWFLQEPAQAWFGERLAPLQEAMEVRSLGVLVVWRLLWLPISMATAAAALSRTPLWQYLVAIVASLPGMFAITWAADGLITHGLWALPPDRWIVLVVAFGGGAAAWYVAQRRWPVLALSRT